jgi:GNAT superfamily N-acetyltransferase
VKIETLQPQHIEIFNQEYEKCFDQFNLPYGKKLEKDFLEQRIFKSKIYPFDFSNVFFTENNEVCGFILANLRKNPTQIQSTEMYLHLFFINEKYQNQGYGKQIFKYLFDYAKKNNITKILTSLQWGGIFPGIPTQLNNAILFCEKMCGEIKTGELFLELAFEHFIKKDIFINEYRIEFFKHIDKENLYQYLKHNFGMGWQCEVMSKVDESFEPFNGYGLSKTYRPNDVIVVTFQNEICGFCIVQSQTNSEMAFFGPIAISKEHRGKQLGGIILEKIVEYLQALKKTKIGLWTNEAIYQKFYKHYGFTKTGETVHVEWNI